MRRRSRRAILALVATAASSVTLTGLSVGTAEAATRLQAESGSFGGWCGDNEQIAYTLGSGETVVLNGGDGCAVTFTAAAQTTVERVRWFGGGTAGEICGTFEVVQNGQHKASTGRACSIGGANPTDWDLPTFGAHTIAAGQFQIVWHPESWWHDAHLDWAETASASTRGEAESGSFGGWCGDNEQIAYTLGTGETVVLNGGDGCAVTFTAGSQTTVERLRWFGGGTAGEICGTFEVVQNGQHKASTGRACSIGGANPTDWDLPTFGAHTISAGQFQIVWHPESWWHDAHLDWVEWGGGGTPPPPPGPPNDDFANSVSVGSLPFSTTVDTTNATRQTGEPQPCGAIGGTVWYSWTAPTTRNVTANTFGSGYDTVLAAYTGSSVGGLTQVACNDQAGGGNQSQIGFLATAGTTYRFQLGGFSGATGVANLSIDTVAGPANDDFAAATVISSKPYTNTQPTANASSQTGEPSQCNGSGTTVWYRYTHPSWAVPAQHFANTFGSSFNTVLAVWRGTSLTGLTAVGCNDNARNTNQSQVGWVAQPGQTYYFQVSGAGNSTGTLKMQLVEGAILAIGDSVVAGHGLGATPHGYPNNPSGAYSQLVGNELNMKVWNMARTGSCAWNNNSGHAGTPDSCDGRSIIADQLANLPGTPTHVIVGVGGNDIEFAKCIKGFIENTAEADECRGAPFTDNLAALRSNLEQVLQRVRALSTPAPHITVMGYYNPFPAAPAATAPHEVCDMWMPAMMKRDQFSATIDHNSAEYRTKVIPVQQEAFDYAKFVVDNLNGAIQSVALTYGAQFVNPLTHFNDHDICRTLRDKARGLTGNVNDTWVYGPKWNDEYDDPFMSPRPYQSRGMPGDCAWPQRDHGDSITHVPDDGFWYDYEMWFDPNCLAHPTPSGHQQLKNLVKPTLPVT